MLERINSFSAIKLAILSLTAAFLLFASSAQAQFVLIDDFESLTAGDAIEGSVGPGATWTGNLTATATAEADPDCAANVALRQTGAPGNSVLRAAFTDATTNIAAGATGTLFYRIRVPDSTVGTTDHVIGITDNPAITNFNFKSGLRNITPGANTLEPRNGPPSYIESATLADNTWYSVWMVSTNTNPGTYQLYLQSDTDPNFATQTRLTSTAGDVWPYRVDGATDIVNVYFRNANNSGGLDGNDIFIDDVYIDPTASNLASPAVAVPCDAMVLKGDVNLSGDVTFLDINPFIDVLAAGGSQVEADCNCDGEVSFLDIQAFIDILAGN